LNPFRKSIGKTNDEHRKSIEQTTHTKKQETSNTKKGTNKKNTYRTTILNKHTSESMGEKKEEEEQNIGEAQ